VIAGETQAGQVLRIDLGEQAESPSSADLYDGRSGSLFVGPVVELLAPD